MSGKPSRFNKFEPISKIFEMGSSLQTEKYVVNFRVLRRLRLDAQTKPESVCYDVRRYYFD